MTKEEAIERLKTLDCDCIYFNNGKCEYNTNKCQREQDIETALNMLKEKESKIKRLECTLAENLARGLNNSIYESNKSKEDLDNLNRGWQIECEKKNKQIDLMAEYWQSGLAICENCINIVENYDKEKCKECIIQYFERKVEEC